MKSPFKSITVGGLLAAVGAYLAAHVSPEMVHSDLGAMIVGVAGTIIGVLTHHDGTTP